MHRFLSAPTAVCHSIEATRQIEAAAQAELPPRTLMQRAGTSLARLALAIAPHARTIWIACGPGNNGGDGMEAAIHLKRQHHNVVVTWFGDMRHLHPDAKQALENAMEAGVTFAIHPPENLVPGDLAIDALLGIGANRAPRGKMSEWLQLMRNSPADLLSVDVPSGVDADSGLLLPSLGGFGDSVINPGLLSDQPSPERPARRATTPQRRHTLTFLTGKPGLLTGEGADLAGEIWLDTLGTETHALAVPPEWAINHSEPARSHTVHAGHKGTRGDVVIVGGAGTADQSMAGACTLAGAGALHGGAGRVYLHLLDDTAPRSNPLLPELMYRPMQTLNLQKTTAVCGCGGGEAIAALVPELLTDCKQLVLDADALNVIAGDDALRTMLHYRADMGWQTVLTPHPLEAARLLKLSDARAVQATRLEAARELVRAFGCVIVLKGSGTLIAGPRAATRINVTGNSQLSTAGTGDVLAGLIGALMAQGMPAFDAACTAVRRHGEVADQWPASQCLTAHALAQAL